jgi:host factor-I protein
MPDLKTAMRVAEKSENIQDLFLNNIRRDRALVTLHLLTGAKLTGKIRSFDKFSLILEANHQEQLIFKHAIATITPQARGGSTGNGGVQPAGGSATSNSPSEG